MRPDFAGTTRASVGRIAATTICSGFLEGVKPFLLLFLLALVGCAPRPGPEVLAVVPAEPSSAKLVTIDVVTNRELDAGSRSYSDRRSPDLKLERFTISIPPDHQLTKIEWPRGGPDPAKSFAVMERLVLPTLEVGTETIAAGIAGRPAGRRDVVIFVHGYNNNFQESLFRLAQLVADGGLEELPILFAWPSAASVTGYIADRDAVTYSRDDLVRLLMIVANHPDAGRITLLGHSMGAMLVAEALRQLRLTGQDRAIDRLADVVLAAPDIDIEVFRTQMEIIGPLDPPITLLVAPDDRALRVSARLAGSRSKIGTRDVHDPQVQALAAINGVQVIDISDVSSPDATKHNRFVGLATVFPKMRDEGGSILAQAGAYVLEPQAAVLTRTNR